MWSEKESYIYCSSPNVADTFCSFLVRTLQTRTTASSLFLAEISELAFIYLEKTIVAISCNLPLFKNFNQMRIYYYRGNFDLLTDTNLLILFHSTHETYVARETESTITLYIAQFFI